MSRSYLTILTLTINFFVKLTTRSSIKSSDSKLLGRPSRISPANGTVTLLSTQYQARKISNWWFPDFTSCVTKLMRRWRSDTNAFYKNTKNSNYHSKNLSTSTIKSNSTAMSIPYASAVLINRLSSNAAFKTKPRTSWICIASLENFSSMIHRLWGRRLTPILWGWPKYVRVGQIAWSRELALLLLKISVLYLRGIMGRRAGLQIVIKVAVLGATVILAKAKNLISACVSMLRSQRLLKLVDLAHLERHFTQRISHANCAREKLFKLAFWELFTLNITIHRWVKKCSPWPILRWFISTLRLDTQQSQREVTALLTIHRWSSPHHQRFLVKFLTAHKSFRGLDQ